MYVLISVIMDNWTAYWEAVRPLKPLIASARDPFNFFRPPEFAAGRGFLLLADWDRRRILATLPLPKPLGFALIGELLYVLAWESDEMLVLRGAEVVQRIRHPFFNVCHTIAKTSRGLLVTSTGTDLILELSPQGEVLWEYFLFEHGYASESRWIGRVFDRARNYNGRYIPPEIATHVNSAIASSEDVVLATLFDPGELVRIHRPSGRIETILDGLKRPHSIRQRADGGYVLSDSEGGRAVLLDAALRVEGSLPIEVDWLQDTVVAEDRVFAVANRRLVLGHRPDPSATGAAPPGNCVLELRDGQVVCNLDLGPDRRIYLVEPIAEAQALALAGAWNAQTAAAPPGRWLSK